MPIDSGNLALKGLDDLFSTEENRQEEQREQVQQPQKLSCQVFPSTKTALPVAISLGISSGFSLNLWTRRLCMMVSFRESQSLRIWI